MRFAFYEFLHSRFLPRLHLLMLAGGIAVALSAVAATTAHGGYTAAQANDGARVFSNHCAQCHGYELQGQTGPALSGKDFATLLQYSNMSTTQLYEFISTLMPKDDPGSLSTQQYLDVLAFILSKNGYPAGDEALSQSSLGNIKLLPFPGKSQSP